MDRGRDRPAFPRVECELRISYRVSAWSILDIGVQGSLRRSEDNWFSEPYSYLYSFSEFSVLGRTSTSKYDR